MKKIFILLLAINTFFASAQSGLLNGTGYAPMSLLKFESVNIMFVGPGTKK